MSQHIGNNHHHHQKTKTHIQHLDLKRCLLIYICRRQMFIYKNMGPLARATSWYKTGSPA
jgi:hypothetical protein